MPCTFCGEEGHNRRRCQQWSLIEAARRESENIGYQTPPPNTPALSSPPHLHPTRTWSHYSAPTATATEPIETVFLNLTDQNLLNINDHYHDNIERNLLNEFDIALSLSQHPPPSQNLAPISLQPIETTDCPICMDQLKQTNKFITRCGHQFCGCCIIKHLRTHNFCPSCRGILV